MGVEIERKFLLNERPAVLDGAAAEHIDQGYLVDDGDLEARVRRRGSEHTLTIKHGAGVHRSEHELAISADAFAELWPLTAGRRVEKRRFVVDAGPQQIEVDVYAGDLDGLLVAEVEFGSDRECDAYEPPDWFGREVTGDAIYSNRALSRASGPPADNQS